MNKYRSKSVFNTLGCTVSKRFFQCISRFLNSSPPLLPCLSIGIPSITIYLNCATVRLFSKKCLDKGNLSSSSRIEYLCLAILSSTLCCFPYIKKSTWTFNNIYHIGWLAGKIIPDIYIISFMWATKTFLLSCWCSECRKDKEKNHG